MVSGIQMATYESRNKYRFSYIIRNYLIMNITLYTVQLQDLNIQIFLYKYLLKLQLKLKPLKISSVFTTIKTKKLKN